MASSGLLAAEFCRELSAQRLYVLCVSGRLFMQESECFVGAACMRMMHAWAVCTACAACIACIAYIFTPKKPG